MIKFHSDSFYEGFKNIGLKKADIVLIHSSLLTFGIPEDIPITGLSEKIYQSLISIIGNEGTIAVPTFNFDFCKGIAFNKQETPSKLMGVFSEYIRSLPDSRRSYHPMQSLAVIGKLRDEIIENDTISSFSENGPFGRLVKYNAKLLLLGADFNSVSMIHWVEEKYSVPYRYWKSFVGSYIDGGVEQKKEYKMFVRSLDLNPILKMYVIEDKLKTLGKINEQNLGGGKIKCFYVKDFISIAENSIKNNPYFFVSNHEKYLKNEK